MLTVSIGGITQSPLPAMHWEPQRQTEHMSALRVPVTCRDLKEKGQGPSLSTLSRFWALSTPPPPHQNNLSKGLKSTMQGGRIQGPRALTRE